MFSVEFSPGFAARPQISHVVFDFDGTLSWLRHGWPGIMLELFLEYVSIQPAESEAALRELLLRDILSLNGKPSIYQMRRCAERVSQRGGQAPDPEQILAEYLRRELVAAGAPWSIGEPVREDFGSVLGLDGGDKHFTITITWSASGANRRLSFSTREPL